MNRRKEAVLRFLLLFLVICFIYPALLYKSIAYQSRPDNDISSVQTPFKTRRSILKNESAARDDEARTSSPRNCVTPAIDEFLDDFMTQYQRLHQGGVIVHFLIAMYMFGALAIVCDEYFVPSLEKISVNLHMSSDVAGATFMAAGSSAPELFTSVIGVFITKGDIGLGTIVGSAVFNLLFIVAICGLFAGSALVLSPWPLLRDSVCYLFSIVALIVVTYDKEVQWYEALVLVVMYLLYVTVMYFNSNLEKLSKSCVGSNEEDNEISEEDRTLLGENCSDSVEASGSGQEDVSFLTPHDGTLFSMPPGIFSGILWILGLPLSCLFFVTIPDTRKEKWQRWYLVSFVMSVVWLALLTYVLVWMVSIIGYTLGIPDVIMGLTFLAAGSSVPDGISSLIVARQGDGDMAVANTVGSNVFDILLCLGLPWLLQTTAAKPGSTVSILSGTIIYTSVSLLATVFVTIILIVANRWYLNRYLGATFVLLYVAFISVATLFELNVFGKYNLPTC